MSDLERMVPKPAELPRLKIKSPKTIFFIIGFALLGVVALGALWQPKPFRTDHVEYFALGYNLYKSGIYALETDNTAPLTPSIKREPGYPLFLYGLLRLFPGKICDSSAAIIRQSPGCDQILYFEYGCQALLLFLLCAVTGCLIFLYSDRVWLSLLFIVLILIDTQTYFAIMSGSTEMLARFLMFFSCLFIYGSAKYLKGYLGFLAGMLMGMLALTKAIFGYLIWPFAIGFVIVLWVKRKELNFPDKKRTILTAFKLCALTILGFYLIVFPWLWRNHQLSGRFDISYRAGEVLGIRAAYDQMTGKEYMTSFLWWTPGRFWHPLFRKTLPADWYQNLDRNNPNGYYLSAKRRYLEFMKTHKGPDAESQYAKTIMAEIAAKPFRHLIVTIPMAYQGIYFSIFGIFLFLGFGLAFYRWILSGDWIKIVALFPALYCFGMYAFFSHNIQRYNAPISVLGMLVTAVISFDLYQSYRKKNKTRSA
jgi:hypothetical protein